MKVQTGEQNLNFATWLGRMSYDATMYGMLQIPNYIKTITTVIDLIQCVYPMTIMNNAVQNYSLFSNHCILAFRNDTVVDFNNAILQQLPG